MTAESANGIINTSLLKMQVLIIIVEIEIKILEFWLKNKSRKCLNYLDILGGF